MSRFVGFRDKIWDNFNNFFKLRVLSFFVPRDTASRLWILDSAENAENARFETQALFCLLATSRNRWGEYYARCRDRGMPHGKALKAVARKRLEVIYAIMGDKVPYAA